MVKEAVLVGMLLFGVGCRAAQEPTEQTEVVATNVSRPVKVGSHQCGATTKANKPCTRLVSDIHGKEAKCWQHTPKAN